MDNWNQVFILVFLTTLCPTDAQTTVCRKASVADLVFLVDGSWSITQQNFKIIQEFLYTLVNSFDIGEDKVQIGLIQYSDQPRNEFFLNTYQRKEDILHKIQNLHYKGGGTKTGESLQFMLDTQFNEMAGSRRNEGVPQIAVVITDGQAQDNIREPAEAVKNAGITLYAVGIKDAVLSELQEIASDPDELHVYSVVDFAALQGISQKIIQVLCTTAEEVSGQINQVSQVCTKATVADIVFLVDSSTSIGEDNFEEVKNFLSVLVSNLDVGRDQVRIGLAQYSRKTFKEFLLNQYALKSDILELIRNLTFRRGSTYTGAALDFVRAEYFTKSAGSRAQENIPQVLILITDGESKDDVKVPARKLNARGISVYVVGIGIQDTTQVEEIASRPSHKFLFKIDSYGILQELARNFLQTVCFEVGSQMKDSLKQYADVVFLVDSSDAMEFSTFEDVKTFISQIVEQLDIGVDKYRIGFAQYSGDGQVEFLLKTYENKGDVLNHIRSSVPFRGGPLRTGSALRFLRNTYFTEEAGSRLNQGTPQYTVVITSAKSADDVKVASKELKERGVNVITVGVLNSNREELDTVATSSLWAYQINDEQSVGQFRKDVVDILDGPAQQEYEDALVAEVPGVCSSASVADIAFLVDESSRVGEKNFQLTRAFLLRIINALDIGPNNVQVALVLYSDVPRLEFTLDTFEDKLKVLNYVKRLRFRGGRPYTGAAIDFLRKEVFTKKAGSRRDQGVQQLAVVITDGYSLDTFIEPASRLRRSDITMYAVGIQNIPESSLLQQIVTHPPRKHVTNMELFLKQPDIEWKIKERLCNGIVERAFVTPVRYRTLKEGCEQTEEADIYFLIDGSGSIFPKDFDDMKAFMNEMVDAFQVGANRVRFGVVQYQGYAKLEFEIGQYKTKTDLRKAIDAIKQMGHGTYTGRALEVMKSLFKKAARENVPKYLVLITDGISDDDVTRPALELQKEGIMIYAIGVRNASKTQLEQITGEKNQTFLVNEFDSLKRIKHDVVREICSPKACKNLKVDIIFLIDTSESMNATQFNLTKDFMQAIINQSDIGADKVQIGLLKYSTAAELEFRLNTYRTKDALRDAISKVTQIEEGTKTGNALQHASRYFDASEGGRPEVKQHLIVVTDGESKDKVEEPATKLREKGIIIHAVGIVKAVYSELRQIAGMADRVYMEDSYESLTHLEKTILFYVCNPDAGCRKPEVADVIYVVHGSTNTHFQGMRQLMAAVVNDSVVGKGYVQFGAVAYSNRPVEKFSLNKFSTKEEVGKAVYSMSSLNGQAFTAKALNFARERFDAAYSGQTSPPDTARFVVLITDAPTADRPDLPAAVEALEKKGIKLIAIGTEAADAEELKDMVGDEGWSFFAPSYGTLESYRQNITHILCDKSKPACGTQQADLVFLVDGAKSITPSNFTVMKTFMKNIVNSFLIAENKIHIGVVQYSDAPQTEFYLNEFYSDTEIKRKIENMAQLESATFTGRALRFVKSVFQPANGGRKDQGVLQSLVVVTDGKSDDDVNEAAIALRNYGINIFSVGIGKNLSESFELNQIAGRPDRVFRVINFNELETIEKSIFKEICDVADQPRDCDIDISVAVDSSRHASTMRLKQLMQTQLLRLVPAMASMINISCPVEPPMNIRFRYQVFAGNGRSLFDSNFEVYDEEIIQKFLEVQTTMNTYLNTNFLEAFWDSSFSLASTRVKVLVVFTDGPDDSIQNLKATADSLRKQGLDALLMIGLENVENYNELQQTEFGRGFGYREPLQIGNPLLPSTLWRQIDSIAERKCCKACCKCFGDDGQGGHRGPPGIKGGIGFQGSPGHPGDEGGTGERGPPGFEGKRGEAGCLGQRGQKGARGYRGVKGENGHDGLDGIPGEEGERGSPGSLGQKGGSGRRGIKGPRGTPGERGQTGLRGDSGYSGIDNDDLGPPGQSGRPGWRGEPGADGRRGGAGQQGSNGPSGLRGPSGLKGLPGEDGGPGHIGEPGLQGQQGSPGRQGVPGLPGAQGLLGPQGNPGIMGESGSQGNPGHRGPKGEQGDPGENGQSGLPGTRGLPGLDGKDDYGAPGKKGAKGQPGFPGYPGSQGEDGDLGVPGDKGIKGIRGRAQGGRPGTLGDPGERGPPGGMGQKGPKSPVIMGPCELVNLTRKNCPCCVGRSQCPVYPTEVAFALDMSRNVTQGAFQRMKDIMSSLLANMTISRSNCPTGARVSVLSYNSHTKHLIQFSEFRRGDLLMKAVARIPLERSSGKRNLGEAMRFVARNVFKRHRHGILMRKVAVFLTAGPSQDATSINTAMLEFSALDITPVVVALSEVPNVRRAFSVDDTGRFQLLVLDSEEDENLDSISNCVLCFDMCKPQPKCVVAPPPPIIIDMDITYIIDSSRNVGSEEFETMKEFVSNMVDYFVVAPQPLLLEGGARVALVQQASRNFTANAETSPVHEEFDLVRYNSKDLMKRHVLNSVRQLEGPSAIGHAIDWTISNVFLDAPSPRKHRVIFTIVGSKTSSWDREKLGKMALEAKCQGFTMFTFALGSGVDDTEVMELASVPVEQHLLQLGRVGQLELPYALQFSRTFLNLLKRQMNAYPPLYLQEECESLDRGDTQQLIARTDRIHFPELDYSDISQISELPNHNMQENVMETITEPIGYTEEVEYAYDYGHNGYFTESNVHASNGAWNEEHSEQDACFVDMDSGECEDYSLMWYYHKERDMCFQFWYGGCGGNRNRFGTLEECEILCRKSA